LSFVADIWSEDLVNAKYYLAVARRMFKGYYDFEEKRFLVGVINEMAKAVSHLVRAFLIREGIRGKNPRKNLQIFMNDVAPKHLDRRTRENLFRILEVEKSQKESPIEFARKDNLILLINGEYKFLTIERLKEFLDSTECCVKKFDVRQI
jgi:hypothetical protein